MTWKQTHVRFLEHSSPSVKVARDLQGNRGISDIRRRLHLEIPSENAPVSQDPGEEEASRRRTYIWGCVLVIGSALFFVFTLYGVVFSKLMAPTGYALLDGIREDYHYCYLVPLTIYPSCAAVYLSWVSLKFFRHN